VASPRIVVIGLGYVGLPLAVALARKFDVTGLDRDAQRIEELRRGHDRTLEIEQAELSASSLRLAHDAEECRDADVYIVTVPTPVDAGNQPDLTAVLSATHTIAGLLDGSRRPTIIYESTVYPGVTEDICGPELERVSGLKRGRDFRLGYSPERINPGDKAHTVDKIVKVIAAEDAEVLDQMDDIYGSITSGGTFRAASIKAAEAAKAIENAQRDINIAFMNEVTQIFSRIGVSIWDVLAASRTKWNFLPFEPGLVGGHCIGVDPYYLSHLAQQLDHNPQVILAGRGTNDGMGKWIVDTLHDRRGGQAGKALVLGLTFKENVPDLRNSRSFDLVQRLVELGYDVEVADPIADPQDLMAEHGLELTDFGGKTYDLVIAAVAHQTYRQMSAESVEALLSPKGTLADIKGIWRNLELDGSIDRWSL
jgi:UDP-N-acetyl-D-galactosamine dehydrogenase